MPRPHPYIFTRGIGVAIRSLTLIHRLLDWCVELDNGHETPCWVWQGHCDKDGYAEIKFRGKKFRAARISYSAFIQDIQDGMDIDHECRNRACINPFHLVQVDPIQNRVVLRDQRRKEEVPF